MEATFPHAAGQTLSSQTLPGTAEALQLAYSPRTHPSTPRESSMEHRGKPQARGDTAH